MTAEPLTPEQVEQWRSNPANDLLGPLFATLDTARARISELESDIEAAWTNLRSVMDSRDKARAAGYAAGQETMKTRCLRMAQSNPYVRDSIRALPVEGEQP